MRALKRIVSPSRISIPPVELSRDGKIALLINQVQQIGAQLYIDQLILQFLKTREISGNPEYSKAAANQQMLCNESSRKRAWFREKLEELVKDRAAGKVDEIERT